MEFIEETTAPDLEWLLMDAGAEKNTAVSKNRGDSWITQEVSHTFLKLPTDQSPQYTHVSNSTTFVFSRLRPVDFPSFYETALLPELF